MSKGLDVVVLSGYLGSDPELKHVGKEAVPVVNVNLAVDRSYTKADGTKVEKTCWVPLKLWRGTATAFAKFFKKGSGVMVTGALEMDAWVDAKTGEKRTKLLVEVESWNFPPSGGKGEKRAAAAAVDERYADEDF